MEKRKENIAFVFGRQDKNWLPEMSENEQNS